MHLTPEQVAQFAEDGYLLLRGALTDANLDPIIAEYEAYIGRRDEIGAYIEILPEGLRG